MTEKSKAIDLVIKTAKNMCKYPVSEVLSAPWLVNKFDGELIESLLSYLVPKNFRFVFYNSKSIFFCFKSNVFINLISNI